MNPRIEGWLRPFLYAVALVLLFCMLALTSGCASGDEEYTEATANVEAKPDYAPAQVPTKETQ